MIYANLHAYMEGILENIESPALIIHSVDDHIICYSAYSNALPWPKFLCGRLIPKGPLSGQPAAGNGTSFRLGATAPSCVLSGLWPVNSVA